MTLISERKLAILLQQSFPIKTIKVSLTAAQIKTASSIPITVIVSPGLNKYINLISVVENYTAGSQAFLSGDNVITTSDSTTYTDNPLATSDPILDSTNSVLHPMGIQAGGGSLYLKTNLGMIFITHLDSATGNGTLDLYITYEIKSL